MSHRRFDDNAKHTGRGASRPTDTGGGDETQPFADDAWRHDRFQYAPPRHGQAPAYPPPANYRQHDPPYARADEQRPVGAVRHVVRREKSATSPASAPMVVDVDREHDHPSAAPVRPQAEDRQLGAILKSANPRSPAWFQGSWGEAVGRAKEKMLPVLIYVHTDLDFYNRALCSSIVRQIITKSYVAVPLDRRVIEQYPFLARLPANTSISIWLPTTASSPDFLLSIRASDIRPDISADATLAPQLLNASEIAAECGYGGEPDESTHTYQKRTLEAYRSPLTGGDDRSKRPRVSSDVQEARDINDESELAYAMSLNMDEMKAHEAMLLEAAKLQQEEEMVREKSLKEAQEKQRLDALRRVLENIPPEPAQGGAAILVLLPTGARMVRRFTDSTPTSVVYDWVCTYALENPDAIPNTFRLVTTFPRCVLPNDHQATLAAVNCVGRVRLNLEKDSESG